MTDWHLPVKSGTRFSRRPFLSTPQATADAVALIGEEQLTFVQAREKYAHVADVCEVLDAYIAHGHGDVLIAEWVASY